jgi:hypothetical protein
MNEFRGQLKDQQTTFLTKENYETKHTEMQRQIDDLRMSKAELEGKASQNFVNFNFLISVLSLIVAIVSIFVKRK